jgi:hypothetical protein
VCYVLAGWPRTIFPQFTWLATFHESQSHFRLVIQVCFCVIYAVSSYCTLIWTSKQIVKIIKENIFGHIVIGICSKTLSFDDKFQTYRVCHGIFVTVGYDA